MSDDLTPEQQADEARMQELGDAYHEAFFGPDAEYPPVSNHRGPTGNALVLQANIRFHSGAQDDGKRACLCTIVSPLGRTLGSFMFQFGPPPTEYIPAHVHKSGAIEHSVPPQDNNGVTIEDLILIAIIRLEALNEGEYKCYENDSAITLLNTAIDYLNKRANERKARGVLGTATP